MDFKIKSREAKLQKRKNAMKINGKSVFLLVQLAGKPKAKKGKKR